MAFGELPMVAPVACHGLEYRTVGVSLEIGPANDEDGVRKVGMQGDVTNRAELAEIGRLDGATIASVWCRYGHGDQASRLAWAGDDRIW